MASHCMPILLIVYFYPFIQRGKEHDDSGIKGGFTTRQTYNRKTSTRCKCAKFTFYKSNDEIV